MVKNNVEKISDLVKGILYASKEREPRNTNNMTLGQLLTEVCDLYEAEARDEGIQLVRDFQKTICSCLIDPGGIHSAYLILCSNAIYKHAEQKIVKLLIMSSYRGRGRGNRLIIV